MTEDIPSSPRERRIKKRNQQYCTTAELRTIKKMWEEGASYKAIAEVIGCTPIRIKGIRQNCHLPPRKSGRPPIDGVARPRTTHALGIYLRTHHPEEYERRKANRRAQENERLNRIRENPEKYAEYTAKRRVWWQDWYNSKRQEK